MSFFAGLASGIGEGAQRTQRENARAQEQATEREVKLLTLIATSPNADDATRFQAYAGLLELAQPSKKKKGLRGGMLGEYEQSPYVPMLQQMVSRNVGGMGALQDRPEQPPQPPAGGMAAPGAAALPPGSPLEPDGPPARLPAMPTATSMAPMAGGEGPPARPLDFAGATMANFSSAAAQPQPAVPPSVASVAPPLRPPPSRGPLPPLASPDEQAGATMRANIESEARTVYDEIFRLTGDQQKASEAAIAAVSGRAGLRGPLGLQLREFEDLTGNRVSAYFNPSDGSVVDLEGRRRTDLKPISIARTNANNPIYQVANELFGTEPHNLTPEQSALVDKTVRDRAVQQSGQGAYARGTSQTRVLNERPLTPEVNAVQGTPQGTRPLDIQGQVPRTAQMQQRAQGVQETLGQLDAYADLIRRVVPDRAGFLARFQGGAENLLAYYQANPEYATLLTMRLELQNAIARSRDVGNLSQFEQESADRVIGEINQGLLTGTDTQEVLLAKLGAVRERLARVQQQYAPPTVGGGAAPPPSRPGTPSPAAGAINPNAWAESAEPGPWMYQGQQVTRGQQIQWAGQTVYIVRVNPNGTLKVTDVPPPR